MSKTLVVDVHQLILGREIDFPIHDLNGVLLVAGGTSLTQTIKQRLIDRGLHQVVVSRSDADKITLSAESREDLEFAALEQSLNERLVKADVLSVRNQGPALKHQVVRHGKVRYDAQSQQVIASQHQQTMTAVDELVQQMTDACQADASQMAHASERCVAGLKADLDSTLSLVFAGDSNNSIAQHSLKVALLGMAIGIEMGLDSENVRIIGIAGLVQDVGMSGVPRDILEADRPLTAVEFLEIQKHAIRTANMLERIHGLPNVVQLIAYQVHERPDGSGYPRGRDHKSTHLFARILHVADAYTAMRSPRPYRSPMMAYAAMECLVRLAARRRIDHEVVRSLLHILSLFPIGSYVTLSDGSVAQVLRANGEHFSRPIVLRVQDAQARRVSPQDDDSLIDLTQSSLSIVQALPTPGREEIGLDQDRLDFNNSPRSASHLRRAAALSAG